MFDVGFWEIFLIMILALVVIGPERLPGAARTVGLWVGKTRRFVEGVKSDVEEEFDIAEFKRIIHNQEVQLNELKDKITEPVKNISDDINDTVGSAYSIKEESPVSENVTAKETTNEEIAVTEKNPVTKSTSSD